MTYSSKNYEKQRIKVAKLHRCLANFEKDFLHKESAAIAKQYDYVCVEDIDMKAMSNKGFGNGKVTMDNGYGMFRTFLGYKLAAKGGALIKIDKWYPSSQLCSNCGQRHPEMKDLSIRTFSCSCGYTANRDYNACGHRGKNCRVRILLVRFLAADVTITAVYEARSSNFYKSE